MFTIRGARTADRCVVVVADTTADVLMVGDRSHDVVGARAHGIATVAVSWGYAIPGELEAAQPLTICATPADLAEARGVDGADAAAS